MDTLFVFGPSFSTLVRSVKLVLEEKLLDYNSGVAPGGETIETRSPKHFALHPFGKYPVLIHNSHALSETIPICRYINDQFPGKNMIPVDPRHKLEHEQWCSHIATSVDKLIVRDHLLEIAFPKGEGKTIRKDKVEKAIPGTISCLNILSNHLADKKYLCGDEFYIVDALAAPILDYLFRLPSAPTLTENHTNLHHYRERILNRASGYKILVPPSI